MAHTRLRRWGRALSMGLLGLWLMACQPGLAQVWRPLPSLFSPPKDNGKKMWADLRPASAAQRLPIPTKKVHTVIPEGIEPLYLPHALELYLPDPAWVDDFHVVANAAQRVRHAAIQRLQRVVLIDVRDGSWQEWVPSGRFECLTDDRTHIAIAPNRFGMDVVPVLMKITPDGKLAPASPTVADVDPRTCKATKTPHIPYGQTYFLKDTDGFIWDEVSGVGGNEPPIDRVVLHPPNGKPRDIGVRGSEVHMAKYLPHLNRYLLNEWDSQASSDTAHALNPNLWGDRGYHLTPYRLMAPDGSVVETPYPDIIFKYGVPGFTVLMVTKNGLALTAISKDGVEGGLLLIVGQALFRLATPSGEVFRNQLWATSTSPDGCTIVARNFTTALVFFELNQFLFINTCMDSN